MLRMLLLALLLTLAACVPTETPTPTVPADAPNASPDSSAALPDWMTLPLTNARSGESFTLADFSGKTVLIEPMATWCSNCRAQLGNVRNAREQLNSDDYVFIALSLETNLSDERLAAYADEQGFDWTFAVMSAEMLAAFTREFGGQIATAPSTPHFVIAPDQTFTDAWTGRKAPDVLIDQLTGIQSAGTQSAGTQSADTQSARAENVES